MNPFAALDDDITRATLAALADVVVHPETGEPFPALLRENRGELFETVRTCDWTLRYAALTPPLATGDTVRIVGSRKIAETDLCQIIAAPQTLAGGRECQAEIIVRKP